MAVPLLSYSCMLQVEICSQQLEICKSVCMFTVLTIVADHDLVKKMLVRWLPIMTSWRKCWSDDYRSWPREEKINNHGWWGTHSWQWLWRNLSVSCRVNQLFFCNYSYVVHTKYIFNFFSSTEHCAWAIISPKEFKACVTRISFALLYWKTELSAVKYFAICS
jgi:hypothetical protein